MSEITHSSHWGGFTVRTRDGEIDAVMPLHDPDPSPLLGNLRGSVRHAARIDRPVARRGWLERGPGPSRDRGDDSFVALSWDEALDRAGVVQLSTGAWFDPDDAGAEIAMCVHGNPNVLTRDVGTSRLAQGCSGQHALVEVERFAGALPPVRAFVPPRVAERERA